MEYLRNGGIFCHRGGGAKQRVTLVLYALLMTLFLTSTSGCTDKVTSKVPAGALRASPTAIQFGADLAVNTESVPKSFKITNTASVDVTEISYGLLNGQDKIFLVGSDCTSTLIAGAECNVTASIKPDQKGRAYSETFAVKYKTESGDETLSVRLSGSTLSSAGVEVGNSLYLSGVDDPAAASGTKTFPPTNFGSVSEVSTLALTYQGARPVVIQVGSPENKVFRVVSDCSVLSSGERCNLFASFAPTAEGQVESTIKLVATEEGQPVQDISVALKGEGTEPTPVDGIKLYKTGEPSGTTINLGTAKAGELATPTTKITLENTGGTNYLYRLTSTIDSVSIDYGTCTGRISSGSCEFEVSYGPSVEGSDKGYVSFVSGKATAFIEVTGTATVGDKGGSTTGIGTDKSKVDFPSTEIGFESEQKTVMLTNNATTASGNITMKLVDPNTPFTYSTTCVDNAPLRAGGSCSISLSFRPSLANSYTDKIEVSIAGVTDKIDIALTGTGKPVSLSDNSTNINGLLTAVKKYNYPDTGVGLRSASQQFTLTNTGTTDITGFTSTSTDLIRFSVDQALTTCGDTIKAGTSCQIAYRFNASASTQYRGYIKIFANGSAGAGVSEAPELIELIGRGVLFNKYIYFGVVDPETTRDITYAVVNDTNARRVLGATKIDTVQWVWTASTGTAVADGWFPNNRGEVNSKFTKTVKTGTDARFSLISDTCKNQPVDAGSSCILRIRYSPKTGDVDPLSAYITIQDENGNAIDTFHATASPKDDVTYFFPPDSADMPRILWDSQSAVIGESIYVFTGTDNGVEAVSPADNKLRRYDAARNKWNIVDASGRNPVEIAGTRFGDSGRMISYNEKLYMYGGNAKNTNNATIAWMGGLFAFDPGVKKDGKTGEWVRYIVGPTNINNTNLAAYDGKIYVFGGTESGKWEAKSRELNIFDLSKETWEKKGSANIGDDGVTNFPRERGSSAMLFFGNKMYLHGGHGNLNLRDDLWEYTAEERNSAGAVTNSTEANKWRALTDQVNENQSGDETADAPYLELRPTARDKHNFNVVGSKLLLKASGFARAAGNTASATKGQGYYFIFDPASGGKNNDDTKATGDAKFHGWKKFSFSGSEKLAQHTSSVVENVLWFHNRTVMGVLFSKEFEELTKTR